VAYGVDGAGRFPDRRGGRSSSPAWASTFPTARWSIGVVVQCRYLSLSSNGSKCDHGKRPPHADDTPIQILDRSLRDKRMGKSVKKSGIWTYVRDQRPWAGTFPPGAVYYFAPDWNQADGFKGYGKLYSPERMGSRASKKQPAGRIGDVTMWSGTTAPSDGLINTSLKASRRHRNSPRSGSGPTTTNGQILGIGGIMPAQKLKMAA
jgi:hypothetical protein